MKRHIQVAMLGLIVLVVGVVAACDSGGSKEVQASDYTSSGWMLTVESAELHCTWVSREKVAYWAEHEGRHYPMNGFARALLDKRGHELHDIDDIWRRADPNEPPYTGEGRWSSPLERDTRALCPGQTRP